MLHTLLRYYNSLILDPQMRFSLFHLTVLPYIHAYHMIVYLLS